MAKLKNNKDGELHLLTPEEEPVDPKTPPAPPRQPAPTPPEPELSESVIPALAPQKLQLLSKKLKKIRRYMLEKEALYEEQLKSLHPNYWQSGHNLIHYLALRSFNLRKLQEQLSNIGLSSISSSECYALSNLEYAISFLDSYHATTPKQRIFSKNNPLDYLGSKNLLQENTERLFGKSPKKQGVRIMVTLPSEAATDDQLILNLIKKGMNIARINCSHDDEATWKKMIRKIKKAEKVTGKTCLIYMDLGGPKLRTGPVPRIVKKKKKKKKKKEKIIDYLLLQKGDLLEIHRETIMGSNAVQKKKKTIPAKISLTIPSVLDQVKKGDPILFDDGKIEGKIQSVQKDKIVAKIKRVGKKGGRLKAEKGINLPDSNLQLPSLTPEDIAYLPFITKQADIVGFSFVNHARDVAQLQQELKRLKREEIGVVLKIETATAFDNFPSLILQAMESPNIGVMIARGDLAIEIGWERLAEAQEEIRWLCEAAYLPDIWATQVLESLAKKGLATRAEITDAAKGVQSECVMLNKGPYILDALTSLIDILQRMRAHQRKRKRASRRLNVAKRFFGKMKIE